MDIIKDNDKYIYKKSDFLKLGVKEGSFRKLMDDLGLNTSEFCIAKYSPENRNRKVLYYTDDAMQMVLEYLDKKSKTNSKKELILYEKYQELQEKVTELKSALALSEVNRQTERANFLQKINEKDNEISELKQKQLEKEKYDLMKEEDLKHSKSEISRIEKEIEQLKKDNTKEQLRVEQAEREKEELEKRNRELELESERLKNRGFWARLFNK